MSSVCSGGKASTCNDSNGATPESRNSREDTYPDSMAPVPSEHRAATTAMSPVSMASCATIRILPMPRARSVPISWMRERIQKTSAIASTSTSARQTDSSTMRTRSRTVCTDCRTPESRAESSVTSYLPPVQTNSPGSKPVCCAIIIVSSEYEAMLNGTPMNMSHERWYSWQLSRPSAT